MGDLYTIGFTKKTAEQFYNLIRNNGITTIIDVRLNNTSQLASFSKYPDIVFFLHEICNCKYISERFFSPEEKTLKDYKNNAITWEEYVIQFNETLERRCIKDFISRNYSKIVQNEKICFLCSEDLPNMCHRKIIADIFAELFDMKVNHLK